MSDEIIGDDKTEEIGIPGTPSYFLGASCAWMLMICFVCFAIAMLWNFNFFDGWF